MMFRQNDVGHSSTAIILMGACIPILTVYPFCHFHNCPRGLVTRTSICQVKCCPGGWVCLAILWRIRSREFHWWAPGDVQMETQVWAGKLCTPKRDAQGFWSKSCYMYTRKCLGCLRLSWTWVCQYLRYGWPQFPVAKARAQHFVMGNMFSSSISAIFCLGGAWILPDVDGSWVGKPEDYRAVGIRFLQEFGQYLALQNNYRV